MGKIFIGDMIKNIREKTGVIMKAVDEKDEENKLKIIIGGTEFPIHVFSGGTVT